MAETTGGRQESHKPLAGLFYLVSELDLSEEGRRRRQEEKRRILLSAGVLLPTMESWDDPEMAVVMTADTCEIPPSPSYREGISRTGGTTGSTRRSGG